MDDFAQFCIALAGRAAPDHQHAFNGRVEQAFAQIDTPAAQIPWMTDFPVALYNGWVPGPVSHPYPAVSNCRTEPTVEGNPGVPVAGLPDCERPIGSSDDNASDTFERLKALGVPLPEQYDAPSQELLEENARIHLQALRLGDILLASCSCEPQVDLVKNLESRTDSVEGNIYDGWDWSPYCDQQRDKSWRCPNPRLPMSKVFADRSLPVTDAAYRRMVAQVHNDARGWDAVTNAATANAEPSDPKLIKGNFTKEEIQNLGTDGYKLTVGLGHTGDYNGYTVSYRMFMSFDHYRKALTSYGPHTADYMVTRLVRMAAYLRGAELPRGEPLAIYGVADEARQVAVAKALGKISSTTYDAWLRGLPSDAGKAAIVAQPSSVTRFEAGKVSWVGGNNDVDQPVVRVERLVDDRWTPYADQSGEVQTTLALPKGLQSVVTTRAGRQQWRWTANFEAADFSHGIGQVPSGTYRFVVNGAQTRDGKTVPYRLTSRPFDVRAWDGVAVRDLRIDANSVSFVASSTYPRTYKSSIAAIKDDKGAPICKTCTFRAWASGADIRSAVVTIYRGAAPTRTVAAHLVDGRWIANVRLKGNEVAVVERGAVRDANGEYNAKPLASAGTA